jgi:putative nucleotidyltransferase with HDIG domain
MEQLTLVARALANAEAAKDAFVRYHAQRTASIARHFAEALGFKGDQVTEIELGALIHDVGLIGVPDAILRKEGPLDPDERKIVQMHPTVGAEVVHDLPVSDIVRNIVKHHHEKWDGTGYPDRLKGLSIPIEAQIVSLCDYWDTMTTARPYKPALPTEKCIEELKKQKGFFDPDLVERFLAVVETFEPHLT